MSRTRKPSPRRQKALKRPLRRPEPASARVVAELLHQAIVLLESPHQATTRRTNPDDDPEDPTRRAGGTNLR
jgi:hypothetical protein